MEEGEKRNWHAAGLRFETTVLLTTLCYTVSHCTTLCLNVHTRMCLRPHFTTMYQNVPMTTLYHTLPLTTQLPGGCCHTQTTPPPHLHRGIRLCPTLAHTKCHTPSSEWIPQEEQTLPQEGSSVLGNSPASWCTTRPLYITTDHIWALARSPTNGETWGFGLGQNI